MKRFFFVLLALLPAVSALAGREVYDIGRGWKFYTVDRRDSVGVTLPHTWNDTDAAVDELEAALDGIFNDKDNTYTIINMESMTDAMNLMTSMMMSLLVGIASIALVVGGIGIMNMMLVTVTERTTEIGLRKALGAEPGQIQMQFLIEAIILSLLGGVIGVIVGLSVSFAICMNTDITFSLNTFAIGLGVGFSAAVGIIFGWAPARKASRLNPIDALRSM